jgi:VIT1/CCC1 family predicted Fe2+/Mn2+ transporter
MAHREKHFVDRIGWLRAAVLGANDGIVSTASLVVGVAAAATTHSEVVLAGVAGMVAGAMSMAAGEYVSVSSQADSENSDLERERSELKAHPDIELAELTAIYVKRGLDQELAERVAKQLTTKDALGTHARDELGISETIQARPVQAAFASAATFAVGAVLPLASVVFAPASAIIPVTVGSSLFSLAVLGSVSAQAGGARVFVAAARVTFWGALAMAATALVGKLFGTAVS